MKKLMFVLVAVLFVAAAVPVFALDEFQFDGKNVVASVEVTSVGKTMDDLNSLNIGIGSFIDGDLTAVIDDLGLTTTLAKVGYKFSEQVVPYALLGTAKLSFEQGVNGSLAFGHHSIGATLLNTEYRDTDLAYGLGMQGDLMKVEGVVLSYDARWMRTTGEDSSSGMGVLPDYTDISVNNKIKAEYNEVALAAILSKEFATNEEKVTVDVQNEDGTVTKKTTTQINEKAFIKAVTPFVGYQVSMIALNIDDTICIGHIDVANESNYEGVNNNAVYGVGLKFNDKLNASVAGIAGSDTGVRVAVNYSF